MRPNSSVLFCGGKRTGKSTVMREFIYYNRHNVYDMTVYSGTRDEDHLWESYTPMQLVHYCEIDFDHEAWKETLETQLQRKALAARFKVDCPSSLCVFEDLEFLKPSIWNDQATRGVMFNGRWFKENFYVAFQYIMEVKMAMRGSFDYAVFTMDKTLKGRQKIYDQFGGGVFPTSEAFEIAFKALTRDFRVIVFDLRAQSYNVEDCVFWYRADPALGKFRVGHPDVWASRPLKSCPSSLMPPKAGEIVLLGEETPSNISKKRKKRTCRRRQ